MERPIATATRYVRFGNNAVIVNVSKLDEDNIAVSIFTPWSGSGSAIGSWPNGFIADEVPTICECAYIRKTLNIEGAMSLDNYLDFNKMYLEALEEVMRAD
jgi:hypothetical protein